jgi:hypothetical protein
VLVTRHAPEMVPLPAMSHGPGSDTKLMGSNGSGSMVPVHTNPWTRIKCHVLSGGLAPLAATQLAFPGPTPALQRPVHPARAPDQSYIDIRF